MTAYRYSAIAIDLGTTSVKAGLLDRNGELCNVVSKHAPQIDTKGGHFESDALAYAETVDRTV